MRVIETLLQQLTPDDALVRAARAGHRDAFAVLAARYEKSLLATALAILRSHADARDAAQEALLAAYRRLHHLRNPRTFGPWLLAIARRCAYRLRRQRARRTAAPLDADHPAPSTVPSALSQELFVLVARLPKSQQHLVLLRYVDDLSTPDIARVTSTPLGTVTKQLSRAHATLRYWLSQESDHA
jgi:RNA polymerase sigma-70 factor (ECF subfamily)